MGTPGRPWSPAIYQLRRRLRADLVDGLRRAPEPDLSGAPGPRQWAAFLAPEGAAGARDRRRPVWRCTRGHGEGARGLPAMARHDAPGSGTRWPPAAVVDAAAVQAGSQRLPPRWRRVMREIA